MGVGRSDALVYEESVTDIKSYAETVAEGWDREMPGSPGMEDVPCEGDTACGTEETGEFVKESPWLPVIPIKCG